MEKISELYIRPHSNPTFPFHSEARSETAAASIERSVRSSTPSTVSWASVIAGIESSARALAASRLLCRNRVSMVENVCLQKVKTCFLQCAFVLPCQTQIQKDGLSSKAASRPLWVEGSYAMPTNRSLLQLRLNLFNE